MDVYEEVSLFYKKYRGEKRIYGQSAEGRNLYAFFVGKHEGATGISQAAIHGREWITAYLSLYHIRRGVKKGGVWILPLTNPDGALLSQVGITTAAVERRNFLVELNGGYDFSLWKANAEGVDLNVNFDARWGTGARNVYSPASENFVGEYPFCAPETFALKEFTEQICPDFTVSWHTKGEEIYWRFHQPVIRLLRDRRLAKKLSRNIGCPMREAKYSAGGYKDWCVEKLKIPAFTVEVGRDELSHPLGEEILPELIKKYGDALCALTEGYHGRKIYARGDQARGKSQTKR